MEKPKFEFEIDFATNNCIPEHLGRLFFPDGSSIRLYFGPAGLVALVYKVANTKHILIQEQPNQTEIFGLGERADGQA